MKNEKNNPERGDRESRGQQSQPTGEGKPNTQGKAKDNPQEDQIGENAGGNFGTAAGSRNQPDMRDKNEGSRNSRESESPSEGDQSKEQTESTEERNQENK